MEEILFYPLEDSRTRKSVLIPLGLLSLFKGFLFVQQTSLFIEILPH